MSSDTVKTTVMQSMQKGSEVNNPTGLKQKQIITNFAGLVVGVISTFVKSQWPEFPIFEYQDSLTAIFVLALGSLNYYFTVASTKKVGPMG